jgi:hypothetical protein
LPPLFGEATVTGALAVVGASAEAPADPSAAPTCPEAAELEVSWPALDPAELPPPDVVAEVSPDWLASPPLLGEATVTGALTVAGALAATLASGSADPTCAAPEDPVTVWPVWALATPGHRAMARSAAPAANALRDNK